MCRTGWPLTPPLPLIHLAHTLMAKMESLTKAPTGPERVATVPTATGALPPLGPAEGGCPGGAARRAPCCPLLGADWTALWRGAEAGGTAPVVPLGRATEGSAGAL